MLFLLGGAARCGKTTLATRAAGARGFGWLSTDTVRDVVNMLMPLYPSDGIGRSHGDEADAFFPFFERTVESCAYIAEHYLVEGVGFYPRHIARLSAHLDLRVVFVGQSRVDLASVLEHEGRNVWHRHLNEATLARVPRWIEEWSGEIEAECATYGYPYVELSPDFAAGQVQAERLLFSD